MFLVLGGGLDCGQHEGKKSARCFGRKLTHRIDYYCSHSAIEQQPEWPVYSGLLRRCVRGPSAPVHIPGTPQVRASALRNEGAAAMVCG